MRQLDSIWPLPPHADRPRIASVRTIVGSDKSLQLATPLRRTRAALDLASTILTIGACAAILFKVLSGTGHTEPNPQPMPNEPINLENAVVVGDSAARIVLAEFSDFQCPFCGRFARETWPQIKTTLVDSGRIKFAFVDYPLSNHAYSAKASQAADCSGTQFWAMHDSLFANQDQLAEPSLEARAAELGLDATTFSACLTARPSEQLVRRFGLGKSLRVTGTPTFYVGVLQPDGKLKATARLVGMQSAAQIQDTLRPLLDGR